jgi:hypothetical protein
VLYTYRHSNTDERETMNTIDIIKSYTDNQTWNVICNCRSCTPKGWLKVSIEDLAKACDRFGVDFTNQHQLQNLNHKLIQANK